ncbi:MAG: NYN domain-containing protein [Gammaproteobacteria bacterium]|nr:NYN domain-containing protein [Gammaproteobacteria bacterium]
MPLFNSNAKIGVYVDVANINRNGGYGMHYDILREFACRDSAEALRLNAYVSFDPERSREDISYRKGINGYFSVLREYGFKVIQKNVKWYEDEKGNRYGKANADLDMAVDALLQSQNLDRVLMVTGDGDFVQVVRALQNYGCRVEVAAFDNISKELKREADMFISGYLIPNLLPIKKQDGHVPWGEIGSTVRGYCYHYDDEKGFGFMRYMERIGPGLWITDSRNSDSPYNSVFFHGSNLPRDFNPFVLPSRDLIFEFKLEKSKTNKDPVATSIRQVGPTYGTSQYLRKEGREARDSWDSSNSSSPKKENSWEPVMPYQKNEENA